jgi:REP element-mobilizing transposase RayT
MANTYTSLHYHIVFSTKNRELWIKPDVEQRSHMKGFGWQDGYGAFTVSKSNVPSLSEYIQGQRDHHRTKSFQEEYRALLKRHEIEYDEGYVWG